MQRQSHGLEWYACRCPNTKPCPNPIMFRQTPQERLRKNGTHPPPLLMPTITRHACKVRSIIAQYPSVCSHHCAATTSRCSPPPDSTTTTTSAEPSNILVLASGLPHPSKSTRATTTGRARLLLSNHEVAPGINQTSSVLPIATEHALSVLLYSRLIRVEAFELDDLSGKGALLHGAHLRQHGSAEHRETLH